MNATVLRYCRSYPCFLGITPYSYEVRTEDGSSLITHPFFKEIAEGPKFEFGSEDLGIVSLNLAIVAVLTNTTSGPRWKHGRVISLPAAGGKHVDVQLSENSEEQVVVKSSKVYPIRNLVKDIRSGRLS